MLRDLLTPWGETVSDTPWQVYPRPQLKRDSYVNLNGWWDFTAYSGPSMPISYDQKIRVPFCPESALSGVKEHFPEGSGLWYRRSFPLPQNFNRGRVLLHIGAADQIAEVYVNQKLVGSHSGGYEAFTIDITDALDAENILEIRVEDDLNNRAMPYGKQTLNRGGMWYTPVSGIWQSVWLESVPRDYVNHLDIRVSATTATIRTEPALNGTITLADGGTYPLVNGAAEVTPKTSRLWSPEDPYLYEFTLEAGEDRIESYFALRTLEIKEVDGTQRLCLNGKPYFFHGLLDQGYWPDGLFTPAAPEAYAWDIQTMKDLGFNTLRKHIKVEPEEFYYQCDKLGMIVFQDMVNNGDYAYVRDTVLPTLGWQVWPDKRMHKDETARKVFLQTMDATVKQLKNHPCICCWTIFNEGWGQFDSTAAYDRLRALDDTRFIDSTSGWWRGSRTDVDSRHIYFGQWWQLKKGKMPVVLSEFGGLTYPEEGHLFNPDNAYGYKTCKEKSEFQTGIAQLYEQTILPAITRKGLCAAIYTQVSDVEDEINGLVTYDRRVVKADPAAMQALGKRLQDAICAPVTV